MRDRLPIRVDVLFGMPIEVVIENGFDGPIGVCANVDGAGGSGLKSLVPKGSGEPKDAKASAESLLGVRLMLEDELA
jgi:hypothetical protein